MNPFKIRYTLCIVPLVALFVLLAAAGCDPQLRLDERDQPTAPPAPDPEPVATVVFLGGGCEAEAFNVNCLDASTTDPAGRCAVVTWTLRRGTATVVFSVTRDCGEPVSFGPLSTGVYLVRQEVIASDGVSESAEYPNLAVTGGGL